MGHHKMGIHRSALGDYLHQVLAYFLFNLFKTTNNCLVILLVYAGFCECHGGGHSGA